MKKFLQVFIITICCCYAIISSYAYADNKLQVNVSIPPLYFFVQEIVKSKANITIVVPQNKNPEMYEPTFKDMQAMANSDMFIGIGMPFETIWLPKILKANNQDKHLQVVLLQNELKKQNQMHLWLSIENAKEITKILANIFAERDPKNANFYKNNAIKLLASLDVLRKDIGVYIQKMPRKDFIIYHPLLDKSSNEYGLIEHSLEQHGKTYGMQDILYLADFGKKAGIKKVFAENENKDIRILAKAMQAKVVIINPMSTDYIKNLESVFLEISKSYE